MRNELLDGFRLREKWIEPLTGSVRGGGAESHLPSKSMEVLLCLARSPRTLVSREELLEKIWGRADTNQESLSHAISEIRRALGDHTDYPEFIQTVPKRGYRLLVEPQVSSQQVSEPSRLDQPMRKTLVSDLMDRGVIQASAAFLVVGWLLIQVADAVVPILGLPDWTRIFTTYVVIGGFPVVVILAWFFEYAEGRFYVDRGKTSPTVSTGIGKNYLTMVAAYAITAIGALIYQYSVGFDVPSDPAAVEIEVAASDIEVEPNSIAVLKFMNIDGGETTEIFSHGLAEDVLDRLARVPGLFVSARGDSWSLPDNAASNVVRRRLRVAYYLEGSVGLIGDDLWVVAQLIDSRTGFHVMSRRFDKKLEDFMDVQREITNLTVANLRVALPEETQMLLASEYAGTDVNAYVLYRRGKELFDTPQTEKSLSKVIDLYQQSLQIDPGYAAAHAGLCVTYATTYEISSDARYIDMAEKACAEALTANPNLHMVYTALGNLYLLNGRDKEGETAYLRALNIDSKDVQAILGLARTFARQQRTDDAEELFNKAIRLQPGNWRSINALGGFLFFNGRYSAAAEAYRQVVLLDPNNWQGHGNLGSSLLMAGDFERAGTVLRRALEFEPDPTFMSNLGIVYYYLGQFDESVAFHRQVVERYPDSNLDWLNLGDALTFSSESELAESAYRTSAALSENLLAVNQTDAGTLYRLAWATAMLGDHDHAEDLIAKSKQIAPNNPYVHYYSGLVKSADKDYEAAIDDFRSAVAAGYPIKMLAAEPFLIALRDSDDFADLVAGAAQPM